MGEKALAIAGPQYRKDCAGKRITGEKSTAAPPNCYVDVDRLGESSECFPLAR
jgi:hypothetical protein